MRRSDALLCTAERPAPVWRPWRAWQPSKTATASAADPVPAVERLTAAGVVLVLLLVLFA